MPISVHNANYLRRAVQTHKEKVKSLYKRVLRNMEAFERPDMGEVLYQRVLIRQRFEENRHIKDLRKAKVLLMEAEEELFMNLHPKPIKFAYSPGGICFERYTQYPDFNLDHWDLHEKAVYPYYFARREQRKAEFIKMWENKYGMPAEKEYGITKYQDYNPPEPSTDEQKMYGPFPVTTAKSVLEFEASKKEDPKKLEKEDKH